MYFLYALLFTGFFSNDDVKVFRYPTLSPDGSQMAFSYQGDIWTVAASGGKANRLTVHEAYDSRPQWSPDGKKILFSTLRNGNNDLYTVDNNGGNIKRLTYHSASDVNGNWKSNEEVVFSTRRNFIAVERESEFHTLNVSGGTPERSMNSLGSDANFSSNHSLMAYVRGGCRVERETYKGPANRDIWIYDPQSKKYSEVTSFDGQDIMPEWGAGRDLYFLSAESGRYNIYKTTIDGSGEAGPKQAITEFTDQGIRYFDVAADGKTLSYVHGIDVYSCR